ncbi:hypothetical protein OIV83_005307 [Microbotryomycetes sp. JL201]|nr:hypothetical protein OIV83_005307 [Microbotryomycetes sp. JL201]
MAQSESDTLHDIHFGASFWNAGAARDSGRSGDAESLVAIRYSTKPGSLDNSKPGKIWASHAHVNGNETTGVTAAPASVYATFASTSAASSASSANNGKKSHMEPSMTGMHGFVGKIEDTKAVDCVLVWDDDLQSFALERVNYTLKLTFDRENQHVPSATSPPAIKRSTTAQSSPRLGSSPIKRSRDDEEDLGRSPLLAVPNHLRGRGTAPRSNASDYGSASEDSMDWRTAPNSPASSRASSQKRASVRVAAPEVEDFGEMSFGEESAQRISQPKDRPMSNEQSRAVDVHSAKNVRFESPAAHAASISNKKKAPTTEQTTESKFERALNAAPAQAPAAAGSTARKRSMSPKKANRPSVARKSVPHGAVLASSSEEDEDDEDDDSSASGSSDGASDGGIPEGYLVKPGSVLSTGAAKKPAVRQQSLPLASTQANEATQTKEISSQRDKPSSARPQAQVPKAPTTTARPHPQVSMKTAVIPSMVYQALKESESESDDSEDDDDDDDSDFEDVSAPNATVTTKPVISDGVHSSPNKAVSSSGIGKGKGGPRRANKIPSRSSYASKIPKSSTATGQVLPGMRGQKGLMAAQNEVKRREEMEADLLPDSSDDE